MGQEKDRLLVSLLSDQHKFKSNDLDDSMMHYVLGDIMS